MYWNIDVKPKKRGDFTKAHNHNDRLEDESKNPNVDFSRTKNNYYLLGEGKNPIDILNEQIKEGTKNSYHKNLRKDANVALSFVFSASPEFFFDFKKLGITREKWDSISWNETETNEHGETVKKSPEKLAEHRKIINDAWQTLDEKKVKQFEKEILEHLKEKHKENVINLVCHRDEKNVHYHCLVSTRVKNKKSNDLKFSAKEYYTKGNLNSWRKDLELRLGKLKLKSSKSEFEVPLTNEEYKLAQASTEIKTEKREAKIKLKKGLLGYKTKDVDEHIRISNQREIALKKENKAYKIAFEKNQKTIAEANITKLKYEKLKKEYVKMEKKYTYLTQKQKDELRQMPCIEVFEMLGYTGEREGKTTRFKTEDFNVVVSDNNKFIDNKSGIGGYGGLSLLIDLFKYKYQEAIDILSNKFDVSLLAKATLKKQDEAKKIIEKEIKTQLKELPEIGKSFNEEKVKEYLTDKRKIDPKLVNKLFEDGLLYADKKSNCVFVNEQKTFAFIRGTYEGKKYVANRGNVDFLNYDFGKSNDVYLFESAIDALSFRTATNSDGKYIVFNGSGMINRIQELELQKYNNVFSCFDNDEQGRIFCDKIKEQVANSIVLKPVSKDFNEDLTNGTATNHNYFASGNRSNSKAIARETSKVTRTSTERDQQTRFNIR